MNKQFIYLIVSSLLFVLSACQPGDEAVSEGRETVILAACPVIEWADRSEIVVGAVMPLSEPGAKAAGEVMKAVFELAADEVNGRGGIDGKPLQLLIRDTAGTPEIGTAVTTELISEACVAGIVGEYHSAVGLMINEVAHQYHIPVIFAETYNDDITAKGYPETFRIAPTSTFTAQMDAKWLAEVGDYNGDGRVSAVLIAEQSEYGEGQVEKAEKWFSEFGLELDVLFAPDVDEDLSLLADQLQALSVTPDAIFIKVTGSYSYEIQNSLQGIAPTAATILVANQVALETDNYWAAVPEGSYVVVPRIGPMPGSVTERGLQFATSYQEKYGRWPEAYAFEAYDSLMLLVAAIEAAKSVDGGQIIAQLEGIQIELAAGRYHFPYGSDNPAGGFVPEFMWHQWPDVPLLFLQYTEPNQSFEDMAVIWPESYRTVEVAVFKPNE